MLPYIMCKSLVRLEKVTKFITILLFSGLNAIILNSITKFQ